MSADGIKQYMEKSYTNPNFIRQIDILQKILIDMSASTLNAHQYAFEAFENQDLNAFDKVMIELKEIESLANKADDHTVKTLALYHTGAVYHRFLIAGMKITNDLVGIANDAKKYAKNTKELMSDSEIDLKKYKEYIINMHKCTINSLKYSLDAITKCFDKESEDFFVIAKIEESKTDDLHSLLEKEILSSSYKEPTLIEKFLKVLTNIKKIERSADRAVDICTLVKYCRDGGSIQSY